MDEETIKIYYRRAVASKREMLKKPGLVREVVDLCKKVSYLNI